MGHWNLWEWVADCPGGIVALKKFVIENDEIVQSKQWSIHCDSSHCQTDMFTLWYFRDEFLCWKVKIELNAMPYILSLARCDLCESVMIWKWWDRLSANRGKVGVLVNCIERNVWQWTWGNCTNSFNRNVAVCFNFNILVELNGIGDMHWIMNAMEQQPKLDGFRCECFFHCFNLFTRNSISTCRLFVKQAKCFLNCCWAFRELLVDDGFLSLAFNRLFEELLCFSRWIERIWKTTIWLFTALFILLAKSSNSHFFKMRPVRWNGADRLFQQKSAASPTFHQSRWIASGESCNWIE